MGVHAHKRPASEGPHAAQGWIEMLVSQHQVREREMSHVALCRRPPPGRRWKRWQIAKIKCVRRPLCIDNKGATVRLWLESFCRVRSLISPGGQLMGLGWRTLGRCVRIFNELEPNIPENKDRSLSFVPPVRNQDCILAFGWGCPNVCRVGSRPYVYGGIFLIWPPPVSKKDPFIFSTLLK